MIKKVLLSLAMFGFVFGSPILASAQSFTNLKVQLLDLKDKLDNYKVENRGEVLGATAGSPEITKFEGNVSLIPSVPYDLTLTWESINTDECQWISVGGDEAAYYQWPVPLYKDLNGSQTITKMLSSAQFGLLCRQSDGTLNGKVSRKDIDVKFKPILDFKASPTTVPYLGSSTLTWDSNVNLPFDQKDNYCNASGDWSGVKDVSGSFVVSGIKSDKTFKLDCFAKRSGYYSKSVTVKVITDKTPTEDPGPNPKTGDGSTKIIPVTNTNTDSKNSCTFTFKKILSYGSKDSKSSRDVALMQAVLVDETLLAKEDATGVFYIKTQTALKKFQKKYNLSQTGKLDTKTADKLNTLFNQYCTN